MTEKQSWKMEIGSTNIKQIKATGVQLSIDHFGTGYTVISYLKKFPLAPLN